MRQSIRSATTLLVTFLTLAMPLWLAAAPAQAAFGGSVAGNILTLTGTSGDDLSIVSCSSGNVKIDDADPATGVATCASLASVIVVAQGGNDHVYLDQMTSGDFPAITSQTINGGTGSDQLVSAPVTGTIDGGDGDDRLYPGTANQTIIGGLGQDTVFDIATAGDTVPREQHRDHGDDRDRTESDDQG